MAWPSSAAGRLAVDWRTVQRPIAGAAALACAVGLGLFVMAPLIIRVMINVQAQASAETIGKNAAG